MQENSYGKPRKIAGGLLAPLVLLAVFPAPANAYPRPGATERVSVSSDGAEANGPVSAGVSISADGRHVAFESVASNLVPGDNGPAGIFVHDRETGATERVSVASDAAQADGPSYQAFISADGRFVGFTSNATNLRRLDIER